MRARSPVKGRRLRRQPHRTTRSHAGTLVWRQRRDTRPAPAEPVGWTPHSGSGRGGVCRRRGFLLRIWEGASKSRTPPGPPAGIRDRDRCCGDDGTRAHRAGPSKLFRAQACSPQPSVVPSVKTLPDLRSRTGPASPAQDHGRPALHKHGTRPREATRGPTLFSKLKELPKMKQNPLRSGRLGDTYCIQEC